MEGPCRGSATRGTTVAHALLAHPRTSPPETTVAQARAFFADDHVHALLVVDGGQLLAVVERADLVGAAATDPVRPLGSLAGRTVHPDADLAGTHRRLVAEGRRRSAVVDADGALLGLLCLKRDGRGFCSDDDVRARAEERLALVRLSPGPASGLPGAGLGVAVQGDLALVLVVHDRLRVALGDAVRAPATARGRRHRPARAARGPSGARSRRPGRTSCPG